MLTSDTPEANQPQPTSPLIGRPCRIITTPINPSSNPVNWQWVAGSGADAAPYFRIFNPILQGEKFDPNGDYVRHWVPELVHLPAKLIHKPWTATPIELEGAGVRLGQTYPEPIVDHGQARQRALAAYAKTRG